MTLSLGYSRNNNIFQKKSTVHVKKKNTDPVVGIFNTKMVKFRFIDRNAHFAVACKLILSVMLSLIILSPSPLKNLPEP